MKVRKRKTKETNRPIFSKKSINEPNELNTSAVEIPMYAPNMGLAPKDYQSVSYTHLTLPTKSAV